MKINPALKILFVAILVSIFFVKIKDNSFVYAQSVCGNTTINKVVACSPTCTPEVQATPSDCYTGGGGSCSASYSNRVCVWNMDQYGNLVCNNLSNGNSQQVSCGGGGSGGGGNCDPKDKACCSCGETQCTPVCPAGTTATDTGLPPVTTANCSRKNGGCNRNGGCLTIGVNIDCYPIDPETAAISAIVTGTSGTSPLSCTTADTITGKQVNNTITIRTTFLDTNTNNSPVALASWLGTSTPGSILGLSDTGNGRLLNNNSLGIMVKKVGANSWSDLYIPGLAPVSNGYQFSWIKAGTVGNGLRAEILGQTGKKIAGIKNVKITKVAQSNPQSNIYDAESLSRGSNLIALWKFNQNGGTSTGDPEGSCGASCNGVLNSFTAGVDTNPASGWTSKSNLWGSHSLLFDGVDDYVSIPAAGTLSSQFHAAGAISISVWAKAKTMPAAGERGTIINTFNNNSTGLVMNTGFRLSFYDTNKIELQGSDIPAGPIRSLTAAVTNPDEWHYYVGVVDFANKRMRLYIDGQLVSSMVASFAQNTYLDGAGVPKARDTIGASMVQSGSTYVAGDFLSGAIDALTISDRVFSGNDIQYPMDYWAADTITLTYDIEFYNELSGLASYEKVSDGVYRVFGAGMTGATLTAGSTFNSGQNWANLNLNQNIDLISPVNDSLTAASGPNNTLNLAWKFSDAQSKTYLVTGDAAINTGVVNGNIGDSTSGINNYVLGSGDTGSALFTGYHLWRHNGSGAPSVSRTEAIDLKNNDASIKYTIYAFDRACNYTVSQITKNGSGPGVSYDPWILTKAGLVYSAGGSVLSLPTFSSHVLFDSEPYWTTPSGIYKDEADITTELLESGGAFTPLAKAVLLGSSTIGNYTDSNDKNGYWFDRITSAVDSRSAKTPAKYTVVTINSDYTLPSKVTSITDGTNTCVNTKNCIVKVGGTITVPSNFSCDARVTLLATVNVSVSPNVTNSGPSYGCIFVAKNNVIIGGGSYKSSGSTYPKYDELDGYYIADGLINIAAADASQTMKDGLKVTGGLVGFGTNVSTAILLGRDLGTFNNNYPALVVHNDNRFLTIGADMIGNMQDLYKQEVGFKPQ